MATTLPRSSETQSLQAGSMRVSWSLSGADPVEIHLRDVLDREGGEALDRVVAGVLNRNYRRILIELADVDRVTAAGAFGLLAVAREIRRRVARLALVSPRPAVRAFLERVGLCSEIETYATVEEAVRGIDA